MEVTLRRNTVAAPVFVMSEVSRDLRNRTNYDLFINMNLREQKPYKSTPQKTTGSDAPEH